MPQNRHSGTIIVRSLGLKLPTDHRIESHAHEWHQLVYATDGVMSVYTATGTWVVPSQRAVWIPANFEHAVRTTGVVRMRTLYFRPALSSRLPQSCCVINVPPLLRELLLETMRFGMLTDDVPEHARLAGVLLDQILHKREAPLQIKLPQDARARRVAERVQADLSASPPISELAQSSGASVRTVERLFRDETGLSFGRWRQRVKTLRALELLATGDSVTAAGFAVGYDSTSAFIAMFKRVLGTTPGGYFRAGH